VQASLTLHTTVWPKFNCGLDLYVSNMVSSLQHFVMMKPEVPCCVMDSRKTLQEFTEKSLLKQAAQKNKVDFFFMT
jgi:hypothetical protein